MGFTNPSNDVVTNDLQTSWKGSWDKFSIKPSNDEFDGVTATQLQESCPNGTFVKGGQLGYTEVEWTYIGDNLSGTAGPSGSTFRTGYAEAVGLDGYMVCPEPQWFMNNLIGSADPGCDDI